MYIYCELCGGLVRKGYLVVDKKLNKPYIVCQDCGKSLRVDKEEK